MSSKPQQRSYKGCLTCRQRRRKCDEERPTCRNCRENDRECQGYQINLTWDVGIASRGKFQGISEPRQDLARNTPKGRSRDRRRTSAKAAIGEEGSRGSAPDANTNNTPIWDNSINVDAVLSSSPVTSALAELNTSPQSNHDSYFASEQQALFHEFLEVGHWALYATELLRSPVKAIVSKLSNESRALFLICVAVQAHFSGLAEERILHYYNEALVQYQNELETQAQHFKAGTVTAGVFLCTFGILRDTPWTMHLEGLSSLLRSHMELQFAARIDPFVIHIVEVLSVMDMPTFVIGRQTPCLNLWRMYRLNRSSDERRMYDDNDVEDTSGIPRSLLDLISCIEEEGQEERLWQWRGHVGSLQQCHLWEAYRFTAILRIEGSQWVDALRNGANPSQELAIARLMAALDALVTGLAQPQSRFLLIANAIIYPLFVAGVATMVSPKFEDWNSLVHGWLEQLAGMEPNSNTGNVKSLLDACKLKVETEGIAALDPDRIAMEQGKEVALL